MNKAKELYRACFLKDKNKEAVVLLKQPRELTLAVKGFGKRFYFPVTAGGVSSCAIILKHQSPAAKITLILPIPDFRARCRMLPGSLTIKTKFPLPPPGKSYLKRIKGSDQELRRIVEKVYGETQ